MDKGDWIAAIVVVSVITFFVVIVVWAILSATRYGDTIYTYEGELIDIETDAEIFLDSSKTTLYFEDGTVFVFRLIDRLLVLHENYQVRYYDKPLKLVSIEMIQNV